MKNDLETSVISDYVRISLLFFITSFSYFFRTGKVRAFKKVLTGKNYLHLSWQRGFLQKITSKM